MGNFILHRLKISICVIIGVICIVFVMARISGDVALTLAPVGASDEQIQKIRSQLNLDKSIPYQFVIFFKNAIQGNLGESIAYRRPAIEIINERLPATVTLGFTTFIISNGLGLIAGIFFALSKGKWTNLISKIIILLGQAIPPFIMATILMILFSVKMKILPTSGMGDWKNMVLPVLSLSWFNLSFVMRQMRSSLLDVLNMDYILAARLRGNNRLTVIWKHAFRNAAIPVVTMMSLCLTMLLSGQVFIEVVFRWPGIGELMVNSITARDYPMIQAITIVITLIVVSVMLLKDILYLIIDPRIRKN